MNNNIIKDTIRIKHNERIEWIDTVKGISIFLVCLSHFGLNDNVVNFISPFFVSIFFVVAGYLLSISKKSTQLKIFLLKN